MSRYSVTVTRNASKGLRKAPPHVQQAVEAAIDSLADDPRPRGTKRIQSARKHYRIRVGDYRVIYEIQDARLIVIVVRIGDRKEVFRRLDEL